MQVYIYAWICSYGELWEAMGQATGSYGEQRNKYNNRNHKRNQELTTFG